MKDSRRTAGGILVNWAALVSGFVAMFFLSPFVVGTLGGAAYGAWAVVGSVVSYIALLDLGMRGATMLLVSRYHAAGEHARASDVVSTVFSIRLAVAVVALGTALTLTLFIDRLIEAPAALLAEARVAIVIATATVVVTLLGGVFGGVLAALNRFDTISAGAILQSVVRAVAVIAALRAAPTLVALALAEFGAALLTEVALTVCAFRYYRDLRVRLRLPTAAMLRVITTYSGSLTLIQAFIRVMQYSQSLVIAAFLPVASVAFFSIGNTLIEGVRQVLYTVAPVLTPLASRFEASGRHVEVRTLIQGGTRLMLILTLPILVTLYLRGETFIGLWMGEEFRVSGGEVLRILTVGMFFVAATAPADSVVLGLHDLRASIVVNGVQALATIVLSVLLIRPLGIAGVAWATTIPTLLLRTILWPWYVCRRLELSPVRYLALNWGRPALTVAPFAAATLVAERTWVAGSTGVFFLQVLALLPVYACTVAVVQRSDVKAAFALIAPRRLAPAATAQSS